MMRKKDVFTISIYEKYNFLNDDEIQKIISSMKPEDFMEHGSIQGNAKSTYRAHENNHFFLDNHKWLAEKITKELYIDGQKITDSWANIQGEGSILTTHNHPNAVISGVIYLKCDEKSSNLYFRDPNSITGNTHKITPQKGLMVMWPGWLLHGSGTEKNQSKDRIIISFNTFFDKKEK